VAEPSSGFHGERAGIEGVAPSTVKGEGAPLGKAGNGEGVEMALVTVFRCRQRVPGGRRWSVEGPTAPWIGGEVEGQDESIKRPSEVGLTEGGGDTLV
jgi:hypothetical protein